MFKSVSHFFVNQMDKFTGVKSDYLHFMVDKAPGSLSKFMGLLWFSKYNKTLPKDVYYTAAIAATQIADCGPCVQITVNFALKDKVSPILIKMVLDKNFNDLQPELVDVMEFARHVVMRTYEGDALRETMRQRYGDQGLVELAMVIASSQVYPQMKHALGYAQACSKVKVVV